ncbi:MAG: redoxin family protein [Armatimonadetes bacterium]|nr:redoxin family protein [Armatimonadota bacterium]
MMTALIASLCLAGLPDVTDVNGKVYRLNGRPATVVVFVTVDCPIANQYQVELERQRRQFEPHGVGFFQVHVDPDVDAAVAKKHAGEFGVRAMLVLDKEHKLVKAFGASVTPQAFVLDKAGRVVYRGRIDDRYSGLGKQRDRVDHHDLRDAVQAVLAGKLPRGNETLGYGCLIPRSSN